MTDTNKQPAMTYPTPEQYEGWKEEAVEMDMSVSEWIQAMVEAGRKKFDATVERDGTVDELRQQRNDVKDELEHARDRINRLEEELYTGEREVIVKFVEENPGASFEEIVQHLIDNASVRARRQLDTLEGEALQAKGNEYYTLEGDS